MKHMTSEELFSRVRAQDEADYDLELAQAVSLELADKVCVERILSRQMWQVRKARSAERNLRRRLMKAERSTARQVKQCEREAYLWSSLGEMA